MAVQAWLLAVVIFGIADPNGDLKYYTPTVEFPTRESCDRTAADTLKRYTDDRHLVHAMCYRSWK